MNPTHVVLLILGGITIALLLILIGQNFLLLERTKCPVQELSFRDYPEKQIFFSLLDLCKQYGVDYNVIVEVIKCESNFNHWARGIHGEIGISQFTSSTFYRFAKLYGMKDADIYNEYDQLRLMVLMFRDGHANLWTCYNKLKSKNKI